MKKLLFIIVAFILFIPNVYAVEMCTPSDEYLEYLKLSDDEKKNAIEPIYCKEILNKNDNTVEASFDMFNKLANPRVSSSSYSALEDNLVTPVKDQYYDGTCWAFSSISAVETNAIKNGLGVYDFSEAHMVYTLISNAYTDFEGQKNKYNSDIISGGKISYPASYFFNNQGMLLESELPYTYPNLNKITASEYIEGRPIINIDKYELLNLNRQQSCSYSEIYNIKKAIVEHGSVQATIYMDDDFLKDNNYYVSKGFEYTNHAVTIVGWDDSISKDNFEGAEKDGAWLIKNSWGTTWGTNGYFYVSYDDDHVCQAIATYQGANNIEYDYTYKASDMVGTSDMMFNPHMYFATKITKQSNSNEVIKKISFSSAYADDDTTYKVYITYDDDLSNFYSWKLISTSSSNTLGIESIYVDVPIEDDECTIIVEYISQTSFNMLAMSKLQVDNKYMEYEVGKNYLSYNSSNWRDTAKEAIPYEPNIYIYTNNEDEDDSVISINNASMNENNNILNVTLNNPDDLTISDTKILNLNQEDVTSQFTITKTNTTIKIENTNNIASTLRLIVTDENNKTLHYTFNFNEKLVLSNNFMLDKYYNVIYVSPGTTYTELEGGVVFQNSNSDIYDKNHEKNYTSESLVTSGYSIETPNNTYYVIISGDVNGDGKVNSGDLYSTRKYLLGGNLNQLLFFSADMNNDDKINSGDLYLLRKELLKG